MSISLRLASAISIALSLTLAVLGTTGAKARPQDPQIRVNDAQTASSGAVTTVTPQQISPANVLPNGEVQILRDGPSADATIGNTGAGNTGAGNTGASDADPAISPAASLAEMVDAVQVPADLPKDITCLAGAIYFEAKSESLAGQLAVGRVIVARTASGHFPSSYCGVVFQHAQFSFVRGGAMPSIDRSSRAWRQAVKIALIADRGAWKSPAEGALFFHAARVGPVAGKARVARIDNHVFYR